MSCKDCVYWLRDISLPRGIGHCSAKNCVSFESDVCEIFRRKESEVAVVRVLSY
ncbi:MAG: hypothetical protein QXD49_00155 [Archaeoglobaceae archaeon]